MQNDQVKSLRVIVFLVLCAILIMIRDGWVLTILISPLLFYISHYLAKFFLNQENKSTAQKQQSAFHEESQKRHAAITDKDKQERLKNSRSEIVKKLVAVSNYLNHLADPAYSEKQSLIKQNLANELAEIIARYPLADLQALIQNNPEIQKKLHSLNAKFQDHKIENDELQLMLGLIPQS